MHFIINLPYIPGFGIGVAAQLRLKKRPSTAIITKSSCVSTDVIKQ